LATLISRISRITSIGTFGRPLRDLDFHRQYNRKPARCQRITVSGLTIAKAFNTLEAKVYSPANTSRSSLPKVGRFGDFRRRILSWWRSVRTSTSSAARERKRPTNAYQTSLPRTRIGQKHHPIRSSSPAVLICGRDNATTVYFISRFVNSFDLQFRHGH
jgi:hypothetical protein